MKITKRVLSVLLALSMVLAMCPAIVFAADTTGSTSGATTEVLAPDPVKSTVLWKGTEGTISRAPSAEDAVVAYLSDMDAIEGVSAKPDMTSGDGYFWTQNPDSTTEGSLKHYVVGSAYATTPRSWTYTEGTLKVLRNQIAIGANKNNYSVRPYTPMLFDKGLGMALAADGAYQIYDVRNLNADYFYAVVGGTGANITVDGGKNDSETGLTVYADSKWFRADFEVWGSVDGENFVKLAYAESVRAYGIAEIKVSIDGYNYIKLQVNPTGTGVNKNDLANQKKADGTARYTDVDAAYQAALNIWGSNNYSNCQVVWADACFYSDQYSATNNYTGYEAGDMDYSGIPDAAYNVLDLTSIATTADSFVYNDRHVGINGYFSGGTTKSPIGKAGTNYDKYFSLHPNSPTATGVNATDSYVILDVTGKNVERFYSIVGISGGAKSHVDTASDNRGINFRVYGSTAKDGDYVLLASSGEVEGYITGEFDVDISGYNFIKLEVDTAKAANSHGSSAVIWANPTVYSLEANAIEMPLIKDGVISGLPTGQDNTWYLSDLYGSGFMIGSRGEFRIDRPNGNAHAWVATEKNDAGEYTYKRYQISEDKYTYKPNEKDGYREFEDADGVVHQFNRYKIYLGPNGTEFAKGLAAEPTPVSTPSNYVIYDVSALAVQNFYAVVGGTDSGSSNPNDNDKYRLTFEVWGSTDGNTYVKLAFAEGVADYFVAEFNVDISGYKYIKLVTKMDDDCVSSTDCNAMWANACFYGDGEYMQQITVNGTDKGVVSAGSGNMQHTYTNVASGEVTAVEDALKATGWKLYDSNDWAGNRFATYVNGKGLMIHINYFAALDGGRLQLIYGSDGKLLPKTQVESAVVCTPSVSLIERTAGVLCMVIQLEDGSFVVIDGGYGTNEVKDDDGLSWSDLTGVPDEGVAIDYEKDIETLLSFMEKNKPESHKKPQVTWMITHADPDHTGVPQMAIQDYYHRFELNAVIYNWPDYEAAGLHSNYDTDGLNTRAHGYITANAYTHFPNAKHYIYHTGQTLDLAGAYIEFLYTPEDARPYDMPTANHTSGIWRFVFDGGASLMITGDAQQNWMRKLLDAEQTHYDDQITDAFGDYLKSDMLQVIHHGSNGGSKAFYNAVDPSICFWGQRDYYFEKDPRLTGEGNLLLNMVGDFSFNKDLRNGERTHFASTETRTVYLPTLKYQANGGTGTMAPEGCFYSVSEPQEGPSIVTGKLTVSDCGFTYGDREFYGWDADNDGEVDYVAGDEITMTESVTLKAVWSVSHADLIAALAGKKVSILGDSISTWTNVSNDPNNAAISGNKGFYGEGMYDGFTRSDTWWQQTLDALNMELLVDNASGGSCVWNTRDDQTGLGAGSAGYDTRCVNLHVGEETPDIILVFMGTNDFSYQNLYEGQYPVGTADTIDYAALITDNGDGTFTYAVPTSACEAYAIMMHKMTTRYPDADIYCMTLMPRREPFVSGQNVGQPTAFNASIKSIVNHFGCNVVDLENIFTPDAETFDKYIADQKVHPNRAGMDLMTQAVVNALVGMETPVHDITYILKNGVTEDQAIHAVLGGSYQVDLSPAIVNLGLKDVTVTMGGVDITAQVYSNGVVEIPEVTGDVVINADSAKLNGKKDTAQHITYLSDIYNTHVIDQLNKSVTLDKVYSSPCFYFVEGARKSGTGGTAGESDAVDADGNRTFILSDGTSVTYYKDDITLGYHGISYEKGLGVHPDAGTAKSRYITYDVSALNADYFYAVVGGTGGNITNPNMEDYCITFEVWGSEDGTEFKLLDSAENIRLYLTAEFNVKITGYSQIKLVVRMSDGYKTNSACPAAWADACVYSDGHTAGEPVVENVVDATCTENGSYDLVVYCTDPNCKCEISRETVVEEAIGHADGGADHICDVCGETMSECKDRDNDHKCDLCQAVLSSCDAYWDDGVITTEPGCGTAGVKTYTCTLCGATKTEPVDPLKHVWVDGVCQNGCGEEHDHEGYWESGAAKDPTCTEAGWEAYVCTVCGKGRQDPVPATGHALTYVKAKDPTCTEAGHKAYEYCNNCDYTTYEEVPATGHTAGEPVVENIVNGTANAKPQYDSVVYCTDCGHELSRETIVLNDNVFAGMTMALNDSLEVKFVVYNSLVPEGAYAVIRRTYSDGTADDIVTMGQDKWVVYTSAMDAFAYNNLAACHMIDMFYVTLYNAEGEIIGVYTDSMRDYAMRKLVENEMKGNEKGKTLFVDMLNYGAAAQTRFNYATNDLANNRLTETQQGYATPEQIGSDNRVLGTGCMGTTLSLESRIELNFVFEKAVVTQDMYAIVTYTTVKGETVSVRIEGSEFVEYTASSWRVTLGMPLVEGMQMVSCTIYSGDTVITSAQDSMEGYLARKYDSGAIMAATWKFIQSASAFFAK